jgi:hypothetical protein
MADYFGIRVLYVFVCWGILGGSIILATNYFSIMPLFMLFYLPLSLDYWTHVPRDAADKLRKKIGIRVPASVFAIGLIIIIVRVPFIDTFMFYGAVKYGLWFISGFFVYLAIKDWIAYGSNEEDIYIKETIDQHRDEVLAFRISEATSMEEAKNYYQGIKKTVFLDGRKRRKKK